MAGGAKPGERGRNPPAGGAPAGLGVPPGRIPPADGRGVKGRGLIPICWRIVSVGAAAPPGRGFRGGTAGILDGAPASGCGRAGCCNTTGGRVAGGRPRTLGPVAGVGAAGDLCRSGGAGFSSTAFAGSGAGTAAATFGSAGLTASSAGAGGGVGAGLGASTAGSTTFAFTSGFPAAFAGLLSAAVSGFGAFFLVFFPEKWSLMSCARSPST